MTKDIVTYLQQTTKGIIKMSVPVDVPVGVVDGPEEIKCASFI